MALLAGVSAAPAVASSLIGDTVSISRTQSLPFSVSPDSAIVGAGTEFNALTGSFVVNSIDVGASTITFTGSVAPILWLDNASITLSGLDFDDGSGITNVTIESFVAAIDISDVSFTDDSVTLVLAGARWEAGAVVTLTLETSGGVAVPAPATLSLVVTGLLGLGAAMRARRSRT